GYGLRANTDLRTEQLILEYVGEIISEEEYNRRKTLYHEEGFEHYYFMFLQKGEYIDARKKGNLSRFFNHSCAPNCHIETWHVMGKLRVGIFAQRDIKAGEELVIDYKTDTRGAEPQKCACRAKNCKGHIGSKQPAKPRRIIRLRVGNKAVEDPPETSVMGDTIEVVHFSSAKSQVSTKRDEPQSPSSPVRDAETEIIAAPRSRQDCPDPGFSHSDTSILDDDLRLPLLPHCLPSSNRLQLIGCRNTSP
ncbi:histone methyltransferase set2, partial [Exophiala xenobiotica]